MSKIFPPNFQESFVQQLRETPKPIAPQVQESWFAKWLRNNPDMEKFIGENLINKIGIAVLVLGIAFFVKYAIDQNWIKEGGRVAIGILCGGILIGIAHWLRNSYRSYSSVLVGGGITVFYFTIAFAFHQYQMMTQTTAFTIMVVITAFAIALSVLYNRIELAIIATIGGFITPFLVSTGSGNYVVLFTYLCILNAGIIAMAYLKQWRVLQIIAFAFTTLIYSGWLFGSIGDTQHYSSQGALVFAAIFYAMFIAMSLLHHVKKQHDLKAIDFTLYLLINLSFFAAGIFILSNQNLENYKGLFTASIATVNLVLGYVLFRQKLIDKKFVFLLIGLTVSFISLIAPIQLQGNYITLFWFAEIVLLLWLYQKSFINLFKIFSAIITLFALLSLLIDWAKIYGSTQTNLIIIFNKGFITSAFGAIALFATSVLLSKEADTFFIGLSATKTIKRIYQILAIATFFVGGILEVNHQFLQHYPTTSLNIIYLLFYTYSFLLGLYFVCKKHISASTLQSIIGITGAMFLLYIFSAYDIYETLQQILLSNSNKIHFIGYVVCVLLLFMLFTITVKELQKHSPSIDKSLSLFSGLIVAQLVILISIFWFHLYVWMMFINQANIAVSENNFERAGLSIIWGISSFIVMWLGMKKSNRTLRVIALCLFGITLVKLFLYDISNMSPGGKIAAFILLGVLLLIVSFMYQRLKKLLIDDTKELKNKDEN